MLRCVKPENKQEKNEWVELAVRIARMHYATGYLHSARKALSIAPVVCSASCTM
jgi:general transcription factor 3C polypeptide 3 (transcription factor C subunit 4)